MKQNKQQVNLPAAKQRHRPYDKSPEAEAKQTENSCCLNNRAARRAGDSLRHGASLLVGREPSGRGRNQVFRDSRLVVNGEAWTT